MEIRNNVVVSVDCLDADEAIRICRIVAMKYEIYGQCRNFTSVTLKKGQTALSLRSTNPAATAMEIMAMLQKIGFETFDIAFREKLSEEWTVLRSGGKRRIRLKYRGSRLSLDIKKTVLPRTRMLSI